MDRLVLICNIVFQRARPSDGNESEGDEGDHRPDDDAPTIVVLKEGDLTAEEVEAEKQKQTKGKSMLFGVFLTTSIQ